MEHMCELSVRSYECDGYNHVNNAVYLNYLEYARMEFLKDAGFDYGSFVKSGFGVLVARVCIDYKRPALTYDRLTIRTSLVKRRRALGVFLQRILKGEEVVAEAEVTWVCVNAEGKLCPLPEKFDVPALNEAEKA